VSTLVELEPFVDREGLEAFVGRAVKERWLRYRLKEGMPHYLIADSRSAAPPTATPTQRRERPRAEQSHGQRAGAR
jgi:hypothetical protein